MSEEKPLFAEAFRRASPQRTLRLLRNQSGDAERARDNEDQIKSTTTNKQKEDKQSFSSINLGQQFEKALTDLNTSLFESSAINMDQPNLLDFDGDGDNNGQRNTQNTLLVERAKNNSAPSESSEVDSETSSNDYVKFDEQELANLPGSDFLAQFGNRVASDALDSALEGSRSDYNLYSQERMDERDLYVPEGAGNAEQHSVARVAHDLDEFDPLASQHRHNLGTVPEQKQANFGHEDDGFGHTQHNLDFDEGQISSKPAEPKHDDEAKKPEPVEPPKPKEPETPVDNAGEEVIERRHHSPLTVRDSDDYNEIAESIRDAVQETHEHVDDVLGEFERVPQQQHRESHQKQPSPAPQNEEQYSPSGDSGHDTLGELANLNDNGLPTSESVSSGMRDLSPELTTYERNGPLTFPPSAAHQPSAPPQQVEDFDDYPHQSPRPPTPPKELNEPGEENPSSIDLGPPPASHSHLTHRTSEHGLHSILKHNSDKAWIDFRSIPEPVQDVLLWRNPRNSAIALALSLVALILVAKFTFISLLAWGSLLVLGGTLGFRVFKLVEGQVKKTDGSNPFKPYLEGEINVPQEKIHAQADILVHHGQALINQLRRLFLVENLFDSVKFGVLLWTLTYIGAWFSGITLVTIFVLSLFSVPKVYELYKEPIDEYVGLARQNVEKVNQIVQEKLPFLKQAEKVEKKE